MPKSEKSKKNKSIENSQLQKRIVELGELIEQKLKSYQETSNGCLCFPFIGVEITRSVVDDIFQDLRTKYKECNGRLNVIVDSGGGDIDAAYNLSMLFRKYGTNELNFIIPRWAKSAATLLICSGDKIFMSPVAELGPLDPQITQLNPLEKRLEQFSPLHIESTLDMIRQEFENGSEKLAKVLMERLQFPLTLGGFIKSHEISEQYLIKLLESRMFAGGKRTGDSKAIATRLTRGYADHGFCINFDEVKTLGLNVFELEGEVLDIVWEIRKLNQERQNLRDKVREQEVLEMIKNLPPGLLDEALQEKLKKEAS
jgi:hypothetical protein